MDTTARWPRARGPDRSQHIAGYRRCILAPRIGPRAALVGGGAVYRDTHQDTASRRGAVAARTDRHLDATLPDRGYASSHFGADGRYGPSRWYGS